MTVSKGRRISPLDVHIGLRIRTRRMERGLSQTGLADKIGVTFQQVQKYEKGVNRVSAGKLPAIAAVLDVPIGYFYDGAAVPKGSGFTADSIDKALAQPGALRLLQAYDRLDSAFQKMVVEIAEMIAATPTKRRKVA